MILDILAAASLFMLMYFGSLIVVDWLRDDHLD